MDAHGGCARGDAVRVTKSPLGRAPTAKRFGENAAAALLLACTVVAILWANSPWSETYSQFWGTQVGLSFGDLHVELTVKEIVNDGLMAFFFFIVGLEVKAQFTIGELTERSRAAVPVIAAIAGLTLPAVIFLLFNPSGDDARAWGVVISTDTAFLVGAFYQLALGVSAWLDGLVDGMTFLSSLLLFALAAAGAARCVWLWRQTLGIYEGGFALHRLTGRRVVPWSEVAGALARRETDQTGTRFVIEIELRDGGTVVLTDALTGIEPQAALFQDRGGFRG